MNRRQSSRFTAMFTLLALCGLAFAQHPLAGRYLETQIGFVVEFTEGAGGLTGILEGASGPIPLEIAYDNQNVQGSFMLDGERTGFAAQLQPDLNTLWIWLFGLDAAGNAVEGSYEQYMANRVEATPTSAQPQLPVAPAQPEVPAATDPALPPAIGGVDTVRPGDVATSAPVTMPPAIATPPVTTPVVPAASDIADARIVGAWQGDLEVQGMSFIMTSVFTDDGRYREELYENGVSGGWFSGTYSLAADGLVTYQDLENSPQICMGGQCQENVTDGQPTFSTVQFIDNDTLILTAVEAGGQPGMQVTMTRIPGY